MTNESPVHHEVNYVEFQVRDMDAAKRFYQSAFDWSFNDYGPGYAGIQKQGGGEVGGFRLSSDVSAGGPLVILYSKDLETSLESVRAAGGSVTLPPFEFPGGRRFHFRTRAAMSSRCGPTDRPVPGSRPASSRSL